MCGLAGIIGAGARDKRLLERMGSLLTHRGPDDQGIWADGDAGIALVHRRLSIMDLSVAGHQPMASTDGRWMIAYNGEVYNHDELRAEIDAAGGPGGPWRGHSDTETIVACIARWGLKRTLEKCVGMFALALWDRKERVLHLARDRFGEKPLYYGWVGGDFMFASELKALRAQPRFANDINRRALQLLASRAYVPAPLTIYRDIYKLEPGCILSASVDDLRAAPAEPPMAGGERSKCRIERYWSYREVVADGLADPIASEDEALEQLETALEAAIKGQAIADVPVGAFLSGGIDSSTIVALYQRYSSGSVRTFTIGFEEAGFDEAPFAKEIANHFGTQHTERYVSVREAEAVIPQLPFIYDEPFADSSQIPTHLVSRMAREQVTVALSGDAGDELFGGYNRYVKVERFWAHMKRLPRPARAMLGQSLGRLPPVVWNSVANLRGGAKRPPHFGYKVQKSLRVAGRASTLEDVFDSFIDEWPDGTPVQGASELADPCRFDLDTGVSAPDAVRMMYCDARSYLTDDILCKVDRAAMACSLETRVPFLDHRVAAVAARIPIEMKIKGGEGKQILRRLLYRQAPRELFERPKSGFGVPVGAWIKTSLRDWAESLLDERRLATEGYFDSAMVRGCWHRHLSGEQDSTQTIWTILMFQAWLDVQCVPVDDEAAPTRLAQAG